ncbi:MULTISPECIES: phosphodiester glycosidase family protein [Sphingobacterium]|uniref:phosphodiester glycosidase family protein n=1 Tax=Sphingobacterium TaxID=28453 RepID=UPI0013DD72E8|nr:MULTISPECIES: phosphodiester glycosidase family protein [unclassified Sphingobacterium]
MIQKFLWSSVFFAVLLFQFSCDKKEEPGLYSIYQLDKYNPNKPIISLDKEWVRQELESFPQGIELYKTEKKVGSKSTRMSLLVFRPNKGIELKPVVSTTAKTPSTFFEEETGTVYAAMNAGFFSGNTSLSLVMHNSVVGSVNVKSLTRPFNEVNTTYYPTRAALGLTGQLVPSVSWVYSVGTGNGVLYSYPQPSGNEVGKPPLVVPSALFPLGGEVWDVATAIGGSPMLIKDSKINITDVNELIAVDNTSSRARSAIGYLQNGNIILLAVEGGNLETSPGLTLAEVADEMLAIGCVGALNLDGGGSSSLVVNGEQTIKPSDTAGERKVVSALIIKKK